VIDYREILFRAMNAFDDHEGVWFEDDWKLDDNEFELIKAEYEDWLNRPRHKDAYQPRI